MAGKLKILVTAGPTHEPIDPVRFIGNYSSGKMGIAIADALAALGHEVHLVLGPSHLLPTHPNVSTTKVIRAQDMFDACLHLFPDCDAAVMAAAVADWTPAEYSPIKRKKSSAGETFKLVLKKTPDILATLGRQKKEGQLLVGFSLETHDALTFAKEKLEKKNCDYIVANTLEHEGAGFGHDTNRVYLLDRKGNVQEWPLMSKASVGQRLAQIIDSYFSA